jgi:hypothetical protein
MWIDVVKLFLDARCCDGITGCGLMLQKEQRHAYNTYIEKLILELPTNDPDQSFNNQSKPKKLFSFIKSLRTDNSGVAPLKKRDN